ncbi:MAG: adenylyltransferase/cytidyltransferase family protein [Planctomycetes bacterium]|nr:adenylyltransferase/cytidyltransferase family protein [Planctomycetota bacterium]
MLIFTNGCFDVFHAGHALFLERCRNLGDRLVVGLNSDASVRLLKGPQRPICTWHERAAVLMSCRFVDEVVPFDEPTPCELIRRLRPDVIVKGPGYNSDSMPESQVVLGYGGRVVIADGPRVSSTDIISRIRNRDKQ